jgi:uncharacterized protein (DUF58 family)
VASTAALFVGCVAFAAARNNDKAGLITFTDRVERYVPAKKGKNHVLRLIREACEPPAADAAAPTSRGARLRRPRAAPAGDRVRGQRLPDPGGGSTPTCRKHLRLLAQRHDVIAVRIPRSVRGRARSRRRRRRALPDAGLCTSPIRRPAAR